MTLAKRSLAGPERVAGSKRKVELMAKKAFAAVLLSSPMGLGSCVDCPVDETCDTKDFDITLAEGETKSTLSKGQQVHIEVLGISQHVEDTGLGYCEVTGGSARLKLTVEPEASDEDGTVFEQEISVSPSMCFSIANRCISISDAEISQDVGDPTYENGAGEADAGTIVIESCPVSNEKVSFTLTIGES